MIYPRLFLRLTRRRPLKRKKREREKKRDGGSSLVAREGEYKFDDPSNELSPMNGRSPLFSLSPFHPSPLEDELSAT